MRSLFFAFALCAAFVGTTVEGWAGAYGSSILTTQNVRLQYYNTSTSSWVNATATQASVLTTSLLSESTATLGATTMTSGATPGLNAAQSFVSPTLFPPVEGNSLPLTGLGMSNTDSFAFGDTFGTGTTIVGGSIATSTLAEVNTLSLDGYANGNVGGTSMFQVNIGQAGMYRMAFDASLTMQTTMGGTASSKLMVTIAGDAQVGASLLNQTISGDSSVSTGTLSFFTPGITVGTGFTTFGINQQTTVNASVVPEPSSIAIFGLMSVGSLAAWRRRRAGERKSAEA